MLRDVYQIPNKRVHVILNGVDEDEFGKDLSVGLEFMSRIGVPGNASLVLGVAGRLVKDEGHPLLYEAFTKLISKHPDVVFDCCWVRTMRAKVQRFGVSSSGFGLYESITIEGFL
ncbi:hypothetical protein SO802_034635 [Lithocarpus litseifolius]|uniref:Uncharacterized protein n=1 Tax=Lithocarpus litseifolius TaxID=425828 RepID=A0AAW2BM33_9ROSI